MYSFEIRLEKEKLEEHDQSIKESLWLGQVDGAYQQVMQLLRGASAEELQEQQLKILLKMVRRVLMNMVKQRDIYQIEQTMEILCILRERQTSDKWGCFYSRVLDGIETGKGLDQVLAILGTHIVDQNMNTNVQVMNRLMDLMVESQQYEQALNLYNELDHESKMDRFCMATIMKCLKKKGREQRRAALLLQEYKKYNGQYIQVYNSYLDLLLKEGHQADSNEVQGVIQYLRESQLAMDEVTINILIKGSPGDGGHYLQMMIEQGIQPSIITFNTLISCCFKAGLFSAGQKYLFKMQALGIQPNNFTFSILITQLKNNSDPKYLHQAFLLFDSIASVSQQAPEIVLYNNLLDACLRFKDYIRAQQLAQDMEQKQVQPSGVTYSLLLQMHAKTGQLDKMESLFQQIVEQGELSDQASGIMIEAYVAQGKTQYGLKQIQKYEITLNIIMATSLIKGFSREGMHSQAMKVFTQMKNSPLPSQSPSLFTYNAIIYSALKNGEPAQAICLHNELMDHPELGADLLSVSHVIKAHLALSQIREAFDCFALFQQYSISPDSFIFNHFMQQSFYLKHTHFAYKAYLLMKTMGVPFTSHTYNIVIKVLGFKKEGKQLMEIYQRIKENQGVQEYQVLVNLLLALLNCQQNQQLKTLPDQISHSHLQKLLISSIYSKAFEFTRTLINDSFQQGVHYDKATQVKINRLLGSFKQNELLDRFNRKAIQIKEQEEDKENERGVENRIQVNKEQELNIKQNRVMAGMINSKTVQGMDRVVTRIIR